MKFKISRTSDWDELQPCNGAMLEPYMRVDERTTNSPDKISAYRGQPTDWWYEEGENHRVENGRIKRDFHDEGWFIEVNSLEELIKMVDEHGSIIVQPFGYKRCDYYNLEIYDGYRE